MCAFNNAFVSEELSASHKQIIIILIAKEGKDPHLVQSYRPISTMKLFSQVMATRIIEALEDIVLIDQKGFMKGRIIEEAIKITNMIIVVIHTSHNYMPVRVSDSYKL